MTAASAARQDLAFDPEVLRLKYREERDKRLRDEGNEQYVEVTGRFAHFLDDPYVPPGFEREPLTDEVDVAVIGSQYGGGPEAFFQILRGWRAAGTLAGVELS